MRIRQSQDIGVILTCVPGLGMICHVVQMTGAVWFAYKQESENENFFPVNESWDCHKYLLKFSNYGEQDQNHGNACKCIDCAKVLGKFSNLFGSYALLYVD